MSITLPVDCVGDTAFVTAFCRAIETERWDGHFHDPLARIMAGTRGEGLLKSLPGWERTAAGCAVRTHLIDQMLLMTVRQCGVDTVVNLGAGLDTRAFRLDLPPALTWIDVDTPVVLDYKTTRLSSYRPACALESVPLDVADIANRRALFARIAADARRVLVITEGLLVYLAPEQAASLASDLCAWPQYQWWLADLFSSAALQLVEREAAGSRETRDARAPDVRYQFAPEEGPAFFLAHGWGVSECRSCVEEGRRMDRWFLAEALRSANLTQEQVQCLHDLFLVVKFDRAVDRPAADHVRAQRPSEST